MKHFMMLLAAVGAVRAACGDCMTAVFELDCRESPLSVTNVADILPIAYSGSDWGAEPGTANVTVSNHLGEVGTLVSGLSDTGVKTWTPAAYGIYTLTHTSSVTSETRTAVISYGLPVSVTFDPNTTDAVADMPAGGMVQFGVPMPMPTSVPTRKDYRFDGWCTAADGKTPFDFDTAPMTEATTIYAKWAYRPPCMASKLMLDCIEGTRTITNRVDILPIVYSGSCWSTTNGTARVTVEKSGGGIQDLVTDKTDTGTAKWVPKENGFYTLTHESTVADAPLTATFLIDVRFKGMLLFLR